MQGWMEAGAAAASFGVLAGGYAYAANWPTSQLFGSTLIAPAEAAGSVHSIALTYDDGPSPRNTPALLEVLAAAGARATFFLIGEHVRKHPGLAREIVAAGHVVGNHTSMHPNLSKQTAARIHEDLLRCQHTLQDTLGVQAKLFRPPYGARRPAVLRIARDIGLTPVMWNITAQDWKPLAAEALLRRIQKGIRANRARGVASNVLLHDASHLDGVEQASREATIEATRRLLHNPELRFVTPMDWLS